MSNLQKAMKIKISLNSLITLNHLIPLNHLIILIFLSFSAKAQVSLTTDGSAAHASAMLDIKSTTKGLLMPRMSMAQRNAISAPATGLVIYQTDNTPGVYVYNGASWYNVTTSGAGWSLNGNGGTDPATHFIGTSDNQSLRFRLNNKWAGELNANLDNIFLGDSSGIATTSGTFNTSLGSKSLRVNISGLGNTSVGSYALNHHYVSNTTAIGSYALFNNTYGTTNSALGYSAMRMNTLGSYNTAIGYEALRQNQVGDDNTSLGYQALYWNTASYNTAVGTSCLAFNQTGINNTAVGMNALYSNTSGSQNSAMGRDALFTNATGHDNTSFGANALYSNTGSFNTAVGSLALFSASTCTDNTAIGYSAMYYNTTGLRNVAIGYRTLVNNYAGSDNVAIGWHALFANTTGGTNVGVGREAGSNNETGVQNVAIGYYSGAVTSLNNTTGIGNSNFLISLNNRIYLGNSSVTWIGGNVTWSTYSDARIKNSILQDVPGLEFINRLRPVTYYKDVDLQSQLTGNKPIQPFDHSHDVEQIRFSGFLAQEVEAAADSIGYEFSGLTKPANKQDLYTLSYEAFVVPLVKGMQEQQKLIEQQAEMIKALEARLEKIESNSQN